MLLWKDASNAQYLTKHTTHASVLQCALNGVNTCKDSNTSPFVVCGTG